MLRCLRIRGDDPTQRDSEQNWADRLFTGLAGSAGSFRVVCRFFPALPVLSRHSTWLWRDGGSAFKRRVFGICSALVGLVLSDLFQRGLSLATEVHAVPSDFYLSKQNQ